MFTKLKLTQVSIILSPASIFNSLFATFVVMALSLPDLSVELIYRVFNFIPNEENEIISVRGTCRALALITTEIFARKYVTDYRYYTGIDPKIGLVYYRLTTSAAYPCISHHSAAYPCNSYPVSLIPASSSYIYRDSRATFKIKSFMQFLTLQSLQNTSYGVHGA
jgi:hypothetical protein